jgi:hypothetical protein
MTIISLIQKKEEEETRRKESILDLGLMQLGKSSSTTTVYLSLSLSSL